MIWRKRRCKLVFDILFQWHLKSGPAQNMLIRNLCFITSPTTISKTKTRYRSVPNIFLARKSWLDPCQCTAVGRIHHVTQSIQPRDQRMSMIQSASAKQRVYQKDRIWRRRRSQPIRNCHVSASSSHPTSSPYRIALEPTNKPRIQTAMCSFHRAFLASHKVFQKEKGI